MTEVLGILQGSIQNVIFLRLKKNRACFSLSETDGIKIGKVPGVQDEDVYIHIEKILGKHSVILGSTGSGKSCTVASILQKILQQHAYSHIVFFDLHNEYSTAFPTERTSDYTGYVYKGHL